MVRSQILGSNLIDPQNDRLPLSTLPSSKGLCYLLLAPLSSSCVSFYSESSRKLYGHSTHLNVDPILPTKACLLWEKQHKQISGNSVEIKDVQDQPPMDFSSSLHVALYSLPAITRPGLSSWRPSFSPLQDTWFSLSFWCSLFVF